MFYFFTRIIKLFGHVCTTYGRFERCMLACKEECLKPTGITCYEVHYVSDLYTNRTGVHETALSRFWPVSCGSSAIASGPTGAPSTLRSSWWSPRTAASASSTAPGTGPWPGSWSGVHATTATRTSFARPSQSRTSNASIAVYEFKSCCCCCRCSCCFFVLKGRN